MLLRQVLADARAQRRRGCVLTCKAGLVSYYEKFGFQNRGVSPSALARQTWYDMLGTTWRRCSPQAVDIFATPCYNPGKTTAGKRPAA